MLVNKKVFYSNIPMKIPIQEKDTIVDNIGHST